MNQTWKNILVALLSSIFAFIGSYYLYSEQLKISKLDLYKDFDENYFSKPKFPSSDIILTVDKKEKEKLGLFQVSLVNYTTKDFLDIPINIKITPKKVSDFKILAHSAVGQDEMSDLVVQSQNMDFDGSSYNFSYKVSSINRTEKSKYGMQLRILFEGTEEPKVSVVAKGVGIRDFDINNSPYQKSINIHAALLGVGLAIGFAVVMFILMVLILGPLISVFSKKADIKSRKKYAKELFNAIKDNNLQPNTTDQNIADFVADMLYHRQCVWWSNKTPIGKWSLGLIAPKRTDHLVEV